MTMCKAEPAGEEIMNRDRWTFRRGQGSLMALLTPCLCPVRCSRRACFAVLGMLLLVAACSNLCAQASSPSQVWSGQPQPGDMPPLLGGGNGTPEMQLRRLRALNADRQKSLVSDTDKLLKLTAELNAQVNGAHPANLTTSQLHMVEQIGKLARSIREKMSTPVGVPPTGPQMPQPSSVSIFPR